ncbi:transmembrane amino acid transporter protein-domain-containing protein [Limtongia smithiae]|uniref:transmembrane amino acid transporter protein-domain-containing protein n=1 Tax=Limtongia smithiae TaxID=1125753 RepID=UPI0034CEB627
MLTPLCVLSPHDIHRTLASTTASHRHNPEPSSLPVSSVAASAHLGNFLCLIPSSSEAARDASPLYSRALVLIASPPLMPPPTADVPKRRLSSSSLSSSTTSGASMATAQSALDGSRGSPRPAAAFPSARLGGSANSNGIPVGVPQAPESQALPSCNPIPVSRGGVQMHHQFGSVPLSSTAVMFNPNASPSPVASVTSLQNFLPGPSSSTGAVAVSASPHEYDHEFVKAVGRHLVTPRSSTPSSNLSSSLPKRPTSAGAGRSPSPSIQSTGSKSPQQSVSASGVEVDPNFYSLSLQGGDITRELYNWQRDHDSSSENLLARRGRSRSFTALPRPEPEDDTLNMHNIHVPGGFRRNYLLSKSRATTGMYGASGSGTSSSSSTSGNVNDNAIEMGGQQPLSRPRAFLTRNFLEFLSVYGHFAGEELEDEDDNASEFSDFTETATIRTTTTTASGLHQRLRRQISRASTTDISDLDSDSSSVRSLDEETELLHGKRLPAAGKRPGAVAQDTSATKAVLLLLKGFVGTGVLFLPKAYYNGGMLFSSAILFFVAVLTYYCFVLLIDSRMVVQGSFGDMGEILYGKKMRILILASIVLSQIGFAAAYTVFTSENLQAFILAITNCQVFIPVRYLIFMQVIIFIPLSMVRNISKLSIPALIADFFILLGLAYVYFWDGKVLIEHGVSDIAAFNSKDWTLFIGTAIFTFEGIGLVIPIHESMRKPAQFYSAIGLVMIIITLVYIAMGILSYAAYGSNVETVVILNMPQDNRLVNSVQFIYAMAILLSTPLQLFPAIRIMENAWFTKSGKHDMRAKWSKNAFRIFIVLVSAFVAWGGADDLDKFVALIGSFACIPLTYVYPPLLHYRACARSTFTKCMDAFICVFGLLSMVYTTVNTVESWATSTPDNDFFRYCA